MTHAEELLEYAAHHRYGVLGRVTKRDGDNVARRHNTSNALHAGCSTCAREAMCQQPMANARARTPKLKSTVCDADKQALAARASEQQQNTEGSACVLEVMEGSQQVTIRAVAKVCWDSAEHWA
jgi:hypothetical protein